MENKPTYAVLNPTGIKSDVKITPLKAPRPMDLKGKVVYCVSQHIMGADTFQKKVVERLANFAPGVKPVYVDRKTWYGTNEPDLWDEIAAKANAVIYAAAT
jgi:hypothetical protein